MTDDGAFFTGAVADRRLSMVALFVLHRVKDYGAWRNVYDGLDNVQRANGVLEEAVYRMEGDPNNVLVFHRFASLAQAHAFMQLPALREALANAGIEESSITVEFFEEGQLSIPTLLALGMVHTGHVALRRGANREPQHGTSPQLSSVHGLSACGLATHG